MGLRQPIHGAEARWFGPRTQGINDFESFATIVAIGRLQPRISEVERAACAVFAQDTDLIATHASGPLPAAHAQALMADGSVVQAIVRAQSDPHVQAILAQTRECATLQSIAWLRLVSPNRKKRVVILSNLPLPEFPITRLVTFARLERDLEHEPDWQGFMRLESALRKIAARPLRGTQLSAAGLAADLPHGFGSELSAKRFRRGRPTQDVVSLCQRVAAANGWMVTPIRLRRSQGGKAVPAIILDDQGAPLEMARTLWPDFTPKIA